MSDFILEMAEIAKYFPPVKALENVSIRIRPGTVHALCGENGAGKSTLMKVLSGVYQPDAGRILLNGKEQRFQSPADSIRAGISMLYQELEQAGDLMVYENIFLGREILASKIWKRVDEAAEIREVEKLMQAYGFHLDPRAEVRTLSTGKCQIVELIKAIMRNARIIVMDEPTSSLSESEAEILFRIIHELRTRGITIIYISHRMEEVMMLADDISVLRDGEVVCSAPAKDLKIDDVIRHMVGRELLDFYPKRKVKIGDIVFRAEGLTADNGIRDISFDVRAGEIVGMAGLVGAGRSETARVIFGVDPKTAGTCSLNGKKLSINTPREAIKAGIAFLTEDRKRTGLCTNLSCIANISMPNYERLDMEFVLNLRKEMQFVEKLGKEVRAKWSTPEAPADSLSGGNQQKIVLARWLLANAQFMIFDEPTRGIDIGAKKEIYLLLNELAAKGRAILVISSELPEIFGICDRILVMRDGQLVGSMLKKETTPEEVMRLAALKTQK